MRTIVIFDNFGPYHWARLRAAARVCELMAIRIAGHSAEYAWENPMQAEAFKFTTLFQAGTSLNFARRELVQKMEAALAGFHPQVVFIPGWSGQAADVALHWCIRHKMPVVTMSESTEWDERRVWWKEWVKRKFVGLCATALVGGSPQKDYLIKLDRKSTRLNSSHLGISYAVF